MLFATQQAVNRLLKKFALQVPQGHIHCSHCRNAYPSASEVHRAAIHLLPQTFSLQWIFTHQQQPQTTRNIVTERRVDDCFDDFRGRIGFAHTFQPVVCTDSDNDGVLTAGCFGLDRLDSDNLTDDFCNLHERWFSDFGWWLLVAGFVRIREGVSCDSFRVVKTDVILHAVCNEALFGERGT